MDVRVCDTDVIELISDICFESSVQLQKSMVAELVNRKQKSMVLVVKFGAINSTIFYIKKFIW